MKLEKGMIVSADTCWYVVVEVVFDAMSKKTLLHCICDNANNTYTWTPESIHSYMSLEEIRNLGYVRPEREFPSYLKERTIPYDVITEVLLGREDNRFDHYEIKKKPRYLAPASKSLF